MDRTGPIIIIIVIFFFTAYKNVKPKRGNWKNDRIRTAWKQSKQNKNRKIREIIRKGLTELEIKK